MRVCQLVVLLTTCLPALVCNPTAAGEVYSANALNQYATVGPASVTTTATGNLIADGTRTYTYDSENRLSGSAAGGSSSQYTYDPFGRRSSKTVGGMTTRFLYDGDDLIAETDATGTITATYVFGPGIDAPLRRTRGSETLYYHQDALGSIVALTDPAGAVLERSAYEAYGTPALTAPDGTARTASAVDNRLLFTGREYDPETGLYYYRGRYYDPRLGRFTSRDPLGYLPDVNLYRYVGNNPLNWVDPLGLEKQRSGQESETTMILLLGSYPGGPRFVHQEPGGRRYWSSSASPTPAPGPSPLVRGVTAVGSFYNDPGRILRHGSPYRFSLRLLAQPV